MRSRSLRVAICVLLGAITTVAVSLVCAAVHFGPKPKNSPVVVTLIDEETGRIVGHRVTSRRAWGVTMKSIHDREPVNSDDTRTEAGLPFRSLYGSWLSVGFGPRELRGFLFSRNPVPGPRLLRWYERIPIWILWPGFLADTAIYATAWLGLIEVGPFRRQRRRRRGLCQPAIRRAMGAPLAGRHPICRYRRIRQRL